MLNCAMPVIGPALKRPLRKPLVEFYSLSNAELLGDSVAVQVDGDLGGVLPVKIEAVPKAVSMVLPDTFK